MRQTLRGLYDRTPDRLPVVGTVAAQDGLWVPIVRVHLTPNPGCLPLDEYSGTMHSRDELPVWHHAP